MAHVPRTAFTGKLLIDATAAATFLFDLAPAATRALKREQDGIAGVLAELPTALIDHAKALGLTTDTFQTIAATTSKLTTLRGLLVEVEKLAEVLRESIAYHEDEREADFSAIAETVRRAIARKDPALEAAFEKLLKYVGQVGVKAAATRRKNEAASDGKAPTGEGSSTPV